VKRTPSRSRAGNVEGAIVAAFFDIANHLGRRGEHLAQRGGLTTQQWLILLEVGGDESFRRARRAAARPREGILPSEIADGRGVTRATVSAVVTQLQRRGLVEQQGDAEDKRRRRLVITAEGRRVLDGLEPERVSANQRLLQRLTAAERAELLRGLQECLRGLTSDAT
jgi:DNA-binding MarR family transcriptional regulator